MGPDMSISISELAFYAFGIFVLFLTPGPVWIAIISRSISSGLKGAAPLAAGVAIGSEMSGGVEDVVYRSGITGSKHLLSRFLYSGRVVLHHINIKFFI